MTRDYTRDGCTPLRFASTPNEPTGDDSDTTGTDTTTGDDDAGN